MLALAIFANAITADMGMVPGFAPAGPGLGLPLSVLAAFLERPFYSQAGVEHRALRYSLQANFISLLAGIVGIFVFAPLVMSPAGSTFGLLVPIAAVGISIFVEGNCLRSTIRPAKLDGIWVVLANIFSAGICIMVMVAVRAIRDDFPVFARQFQPFETPLGIGLTVVCLVVLLGSFYDPSAKPRTAPNVEAHAAEQGVNAASEVGSESPPEQLAGPKND